MSESRLALLREILDILDRYATTVKRADLEHDREVWLKVKAALEVAAQCAIDLALVLVAKRGIGVPQSYREVFVLLARAGVVDGELASNLEKWAGLRNVLIHVYTALDLDRIHGALSQTAPLRSFMAIAEHEIAQP